MNNRKVREREGEGESERERERRGGIETDREAVHLMA